MTTNPPHTIRKPVGVGFWTELGKGKEEAIPLEIFFKPSHGYGKFYIYFTLAPQRISYFTQWLPKAIFFYSGWIEPEGGKNWPNPSGKPERPRKRVGHGFALSDPKKGQVRV